MPSSLPPIPRRAQRGGAARRASWCLAALCALVATASAGPTAPAPSAVELLGKAYRAYDAGSLDEAAAALAALDESKLENRDYVAWLRGQLALVGGDGEAAARHFTALRQTPDSRYAAAVPWRLADADWERGRRDEAVAAYRRLLETPRAASYADLATVRFRIASHAADGASAATGRAAAKAKRAAIAALRDFILTAPRHPLAERAEVRLRLLGGPRAGALRATDRITRARNLIASHLWHEAVAELALVPESAALAVRRQRDYWLGTALFKMRRRYADAGKLLLSVAPHLGADGAEAMFHGARALSRADEDDRAITWYRKVVEKYPRSEWAQEAQFLIGWLELNRGRYAQAIEPLEQVIRKYPRSKWVDDALWFSGLAHYLAGEWQAARTQLGALAKRGGALEAGKGQYWLARIDEREGKAEAARTGYLALVKRWPFSWYALLSRARLAAAGVAVGPFGADAVAPTGPRFESKVVASLAADPLIRRTDELTAAGLGVEAGYELERAERGFLARHGRGPGLAFLMDRYRKAGNFNRPWMLGVVYGGAALNGPAEGSARAWWQHAYPEAYKALVDKYRDVGKNPVGYLHAIMRKESGFDPLTLSYADAQGLLQMIPATTLRVAEKLGLPYAPGRLYEPEFNIQTGSWYIGTLLQKFRGQIPLGAGAFNSGPRPVMRWCDQNGHRELDEFVELVSYTQTREYMKKVTENYARYRYLLLGEVYDLPLTVDKAYRNDDVTY